ncbi:MAG: SDR family NAD(P)-dependent oxidoreductase [Acidobacteria bacterium]|nr:MAG: SDR family NAD(P)-dependent oxidoreductase [Acidobacteriota bacterium]
MRRRQRSSSAARARPTAITGGSSGIGLALARRYAREGSRLLLIARREAQLHEAARELAGLGAEVRAAAADVTDRERLREAVARAAAGWPPPARLICAAGQLAAGRAQPLDAAAARRLFEVNLLGTAATVDTFLPMMLPHGGTIALVASMVARHPFTGLAAYAISKWALDGYHRALASQLRGTGVRVLVAYPSIVDTPMVHRLLAEEAVPPAVYRAWPARDPQRVAERLARAIDAGRPRIFVSAADRAADLLLRAAPILGAALLDRLTAIRAR